MLCQCFVCWNCMRVSAGGALVVQRWTPLGGCKLFSQFWELFILPNWGLQYLVALRTRLLDDRLVAWCCQERPTSVRQAIEGSHHWIKTHVVKLSHSWLFHLFRLGNSCINDICIATISSVGSIHLFFSFFFKRKSGKEAMNWFQYSSLMIIVVTFGHCSVPAGCSAGGGLWHPGTSPGWYALLWGAGGKTHSVKLSDFVTA